MVNIKLEKKIRRLKGEEKDPLYNHRQQQQGN